MEIIEGLVMWIGVELIHSTKGRRFYTSKVFDIETADLIVMNHRTEYDHGKRYMEAAVVNIHIRHGDTIVL